MISEFLVKIGRLIYEKPCHDLGHSRHERNEGGEPFCASYHIHKHVIEQL